jgi:PBSX family phage portal protein
LGKVVVRTIKSSIGNIPIVKADTPTANKADEVSTYGDVIETKYDICGLKELIENSTIIPQCIKAFKLNIPGFGIGIRYKVDTEETSEMKTEWNKLDNILKAFSLDTPIEELWGAVMKDKKGLGIGYLEIIRNIGNEVVQGEYVDPEYIRASKKGPLIDVVINRNGIKIKRKKRFRKYIQNINGEVVYFKELGDPRHLNSETGEYSEEIVKNEANELLPIREDNEVYGIPCWIGQAMHVQGSRLAETLNYNYFINGRHTPIMIIIKGGTLSEQSWKELKEYMNSIKGVENSHNFIVLEAEKIESDVNALGLEDDKGQSVDVEIKDLSPMLQSDALFQEYLDNSRKKVQSSFNLPDLYVGYTKDFNKATAQTVMEVTEKQVFAPERKVIAWIINNILFSEYEFKYVEAYLKAPDLTNVDDIYKIFLAALKGGGATPNDSREILSKVLGKDLENFEEDWANIPIEIQRLNQMQNKNNIEVEKSDNQIINVLKDVRDALEELRAG